MSGALQWQAQLDSNRATRDLTVSTQRSLVLIVPPQRQCLTADQDNMSQITLTNFGKMPCRDLRIDYSSGTFEAMPREMPALVAHEGPTTLVPEVEYGIAVAIRPTESGLADLERGRLHYCAFGQITYTDALGVEGETGFCFMWQNQASLLPSKDGEATPLCQWVACDNDWNHVR